MLGVILALFLLPGMARATDPVVSAAWLKTHLTDPDIVVLDIRGRLSNTTRADYLAAHIPGAVYSDYLSSGWRRTVILNLSSNPCRLEAIREIWPGSRRGVRCR